MNIFDIIQVPFGYVISTVYSWTNSYTIALLAFAVVCKIVLFPLGIKQQKNSQKQAALKPKEDRIRKKYAGRTDRVTQQKMQSEIMELYQKEKFSPMGGCLPLIVQMVVLITLYTVVRLPLTYVSHFDTKTVDNIHQVVVSLDTSKENNEGQAQTNETKPQAPQSSQSSQTAPSSSTAPQNTPEDAFQQMKDIQFINNNKQAFVDAYNQKFGAGECEKFVDKIPELKMFGVIDLGVLPANDKLISVSMIFVILSFVTAYGGQVITRKFTYQPANGDAATQSSMRIMNIMMPLFSAYISYAMVPLAVSVYWIATNILNPVQQIVLSKMFKIHVYTEEELKAIDKEITKKEPKVTEALTKRKSLVYDDDDDDTAIDAQKTEDTKKVKEKKDPDSSPIEKAKLKDEDAK